MSAQVVRLHSRKPVQPPERRPYHVGVRRLHWWESFSKDWQVSVTEFGSFETKRGWYNWSVDVDDTDLERFLRDKKEGAEARGLEFVLVGYTLKDFQAPT